jgi:glutamine amidotransferase
VLFDYGSGNICSAERALERAGASVDVTDSVSAALVADGVVVPGVGAFAACMASLERVGGDQLVRDRVADGLPMLAICVGHQVLFERGDEHGVATSGLEIWPGDVTRLDAPVLPHIGWNTVAPAAGSAMFAGIETERFYFVHSYAAHRPPPSGTGSAVAPGVSRASYGDDTFIAAVEDGPVWSTQFHPEKSGAAGLRLLANWIATLRG